MAIRKSEIQLRGFKAVSNGALDSDSLPTRIKVLDWGENDSTQGKVILDEISAQVFASAQKEIGRERVALDFEHNTVPGTEEYQRTSEPRAVAAFATPAIINGDGLWYEDIKWTPHGESHARDYEDLSPAPFLVDGRVVALHSAALTRSGAIADLKFYSTAGVDTDIDKLARLSLPAPALPDDFPPLDSREQVISALAYINQPRHFKALSAATFPLVKSALESAISKHQIPWTFSDISKLPAYASAATFIDPITKQTPTHMSEHMAAIKKHLGMHESESDEHVMEHIAGWMKKNPKAMGKTAPLGTAAPGSTVDHYGLSSEQFKTMTAELLSGVVAQMEVKITPLVADIKALNLELEKKEAAAQLAKFNDIVSKATAEGKVLPADAVLKTMTVEQIEGILPTLAKKVPTKSLSKTFTAKDGQPQPTALDRALGRQPVAYNANGQSARERTSAIFAERIREVKEAQSFAIAT